MWAQSFCGRFRLRAFRGGAQGLGICICGGVRLAARASAGRGRSEKLWAHVVAEQSKETHYK